VTRWLTTLAVRGALGAVAEASAQEFSVEGYGDLRTVSSFGQTGWLDGGLGKLRFEGDTGKGTTVTVPELFAEARLQPSSEWLVVGNIRYEEYQKTAFDTLEAYARYRPVSTTPLRWSVKAGAFFPPISLENTAIGWTSPWTLTPSAIDSWVGEDLRTIGAEGRLEWRFGHGAAEFFGSVFGWNDLAGTVLAERGWVLGDRPVGLFDHFRLPDVLARRFGEAIPYTAPLITEADNAPGWYAGASLREDGWGKLALMRYENRTNPSVRRGDQFGWHTDFWNLSYQTSFGEVTLLTDAMSGATAVAPSPVFANSTDFQSAYALLGWETGDWTLTGRVEFFATQQHRTFHAPTLSEHGMAQTVAANWYVYSWLRLTAEAVIVESTRYQRSLAGLSPYSTEAQLQLGARLFF
jgi:hypothetical protein